jgi:type II protein arginine methyltransferase
MSPTRADTVRRALESTLDLSALSAGARQFVGALVGREDLPLRLARMALVFKRQDQKKDARLLAQAALDLAPGDHRVRVLADWLNRRQAPLWHFAIIHDENRNQTYARAIRHFVKPGMVVFEIGTGTGLLAMLAAEAGARHVYTCERRADVATAARDIIARNGFAHRVTVIGKDAHAVQLGVDLPERADLFVAEIVDNTLLGEGVLPLTELARQKFLKPEAILLPRTVSAMGYLQGGAGHGHLYRMGRVMGFDLTPFNRFTPVELNAGKGGGQVEPLSDVAELIRFDLREEAPKEAVQNVVLTANQSGRVESLLRWLRLDFGEGIIFENRPPQVSSWDPHLHILPEPLSVQAGDPVAFEISHDRDRLFVVPVTGSAPRPTEFPGL